MNGRYAAVALALAVVLALVAGGPLGGGGVVEAEITDFTVSDGHVEAENVSTATLSVDGEWTLSGGEQGDVKEIRIGLSVEASGERVQLDEHLKSYPMKGESGTFSMSGDVLAHPTIDPATFDVAPGETASVDANAVLTIRAFDGNGNVIYRDERTAPFTVGVTGPTEPVSVDVAATGDVDLG